MRERPRIIYYVHDLNDPAVARRVRMFTAGGAEVTVAGFRRDDRLPAEVAGASAVDLGRTRDGRLVQRAIAVVRNLVRPGLVLTAARDADVVVGRNLEALALARRARRARPAARLVYECLDIHRTLLGSSLAARGVQAVEAELLRGVDLLLVSSPAFEQQYFSARPSLAAPIRLVENKVLALGAPRPEPVPATSGPPWTIGWFGNLRCRRTWAVLRRLAADLDGRVAVLVAGRPSAAEFDDLPGEVAAAPQCTFLGPFTPDDLPVLYGRCHFAWAIDWFEDGLNSRWLLPNRLYEASCYGAVPIALRSVEVGAWLQRHGAGLLLDDEDPEGAMRQILEGLDHAGYAALRAAVAAIPRDALVADLSECAALVKAVAGR